MKNILTAIALVAALAQSMVAQTVNWKALHGDQQNIMQLNLGYDFGVTAQAGYGRKFDFIRPVVVGLDFSLPMGNVLLDDFKLRLGAQVEVVEIGAFSASVKILSNFRRFENEMVRIVSFGSEFGAVAGYYTESWSAAGEFGFDKSIVSHLKHSDIMREFFPAIRDGWYIPSGGNFYYGVQGSKTIGESLDITLRVGATKGQPKDEDAVLPYYLQLGLGFRF